MAFEGMKWFKCDLQMQTPADGKHWRGLELADKAGAEAFISRCHNQGLDVIGITDHNFASKEFLKLLQQANDDMELGYGRLVIFPGFELEADIGMGIHALALFDSHTDIVAVDHKLTQCGVPIERFPGGVPASSTQNLQQIIKTVQQKDANGRLTGIVICAHPTHKNGLFDNDSIAGWLQQSEWKNPRLYGVEVPKPVEKMSKGFQKLFSNGDQCDPGWRRIRPMGRFMSSDCKSLEKIAEDENYIGKRHCWVKMSRPSIESLRQACLDHESRIRLTPEAPEVRHTHINRLRIQDVRYLANQEIEFSPGLNCIIGGRGSGKSTILEYLRMALRAYPPGFDIQGESTAAQRRRRIVETFDDDSLLELTITHRGLVDEVMVDGFKKTYQGDLLRPGVQDAGTVFQQFGILAFSQDEVTELAKDSNFLALIDGLAGQLLAENHRKSDEIILQIRAAISERDAIRGMEADLPGYRQQLDEVSRQLDSVTRVQSGLNAHRAAELDAGALRQIKAEVDDVIAATESLAKNDLLEAIAQLPTLDPESPRLDQLKAIQDRVVGSIRGLIDAINAGAKDFEGIVGVDANDWTWAGVEASINAASQAFTDECLIEGISPEEAGRLSELATRQRDLALAIAQRERLIAERKSRLVNVPKKVAELVDIWKARTAIREGVIQKILASPTMPRTRDQKPIIVPSLQYAADRRSFIDTWLLHWPDGRSRLGKAWGNDPLETDSLPDQIFNGFLANPGTAGNAFFWLQERLRHPELETLQNLIDLGSDLNEFIAADSDRWLKLVLHRYEDSADLVLLRSDGTQAGSLAKKDLSDGQQNTAILSLLLAQGEGPVLIDQPESELDSAFLFNELVPMLRHSKTNRQIIVVTHNPNIPVNGDAELVYALESQGGKGVVLTQGGLDRHEVTTAILDTMEGSREAFRRRQEKYCF